jgi:subtilisin family serine protease
MRVLNKSAVLMGLAAVLACGQSKRDRDVDRFIVGRKQMSDMGGGVGGGAEGGMNKHIVFQRLDDATFLVECPRSQRCDEILQKDPNVDFVEEDVKVSIEPLMHTMEDNSTLFDGQVDEKVSIPGRDRDCEGKPFNIPVGSWGLDRIDGALDGVVMRPKAPKRKRRKKWVHSMTGANSYVYVLDTGVRSDHVEFCERVDRGANFFADDVKGGDSDCNGHGTHVASTVAGNTFGVAPGATIVPVRVLGCSGSGSVSGVIKGIDWALKHDTGNAKVKGRPKIINMSLGGGRSTAMNQAIKRATDAGAIVVVAAGNSGRNACFSSPAGAPEAITVGATTSRDTMSLYSSRGPCVDIFAPGSGINGASIRSKTANAFLSGTSMAAPHVSGVLAIMAERSPRKSI